MQEPCVPPIAEKRPPVPLLAHQIGPDAPGIASWGRPRGLRSALLGRVRRALSGLATGAAVIWLAGCSVPTPTASQGLDYGFRTPKQAFRSFRTAVQGELLAEEYRCFSSLWRRQNGVTSLLRYGEARDELIERIPQLRWAVYRAEDPELLMLRPPWAVVQARIPGPLWFKDRYLAVRLYRQGYWEAFDEQNPDVAASGDTVSDPWKSGLFGYVDRYDSFRITVDGFSEFTEDTSPEAILEMRAGYEWKIFKVEIFDEPLPAGAILED